MWQDGSGGLGTGGSSGLLRGTAGYMRLRKLPLVCLFTCHRTTTDFDETRLKSPDGLLCAVLFNVGPERPDEPTCLKKACLNSVDADGL